MLDANDLFSSLKGIQKKNISLDIFQGASPQGFAAKLNYSSFYLNILKPDVVFPH